jgi:nucleotide-binding universal stress UspA family protein
MIDINTILCPVDFSDFSRHALAHALQLARWFRSSLTVLYVYPLPAAPPPVLFGGFPGPIPPAGPSTSSSLPSGPEHDEALARVSQFVSTIDSTDVEVSVQALPGSPASTILAEAARIHSDVIVLGTHGHSGFERWVLGSITEKVLRKAPCAVITIPAPVSAPPPDALQLFKRILCPTDFSAASLKALEYALALGKEADADLILMHVIEGLPDAPHWQQPPGPAVVEYLRMNEEDALSRMRALVPGDAHAWCHPKTLLKTGRPYEEILRTVVELDIHLIVMGVHGRNAIDRLFFGSTTAHVVRAAACPVLTVKDQRE